MKKLTQMFQTVKQSKVAHAVVAGSLLAATNVAMAAPIDIDADDIVQTLGLAVITVTAVCTAALSIVVVVRVFKYVRTAM